MSALPITRDEFHWIPSESSLRWLFRKNFSRAVPSFSLYPWIICMDAMLFVQISHQITSSKVFMTSLSSYRSSKMRWNAQVPRKVLSDRTIYCSWPMRINTGLSVPRDLGEQGSEIRSTEEISWLVSIGCRGWFWEWSGITKAIFSLLDPWWVGFLQRKKSYLLAVFFIFYTWSISSTYRLKRAKFIAGRCISKRKSLC